jgi:hypothetical protein
MKKTNFLLAFLISIFLFFSCSTNINVRVNRPAELDLSFAETIAVLPFAEDPTFWDYLLFGTDTYEIGKYFTTRLQSKLTDSNYFSVLNPAQVQVSLSNGKIPPSDIYITGNIYNFYTDIEENETKEKNSKTNEVEVIIEYYRTLRFSLTYQIVDSATGEILKKFQDSYTLKSDYELEKSKVPSACEVAKSEINDIISDLITQITPHSVTKSITLLKDKTKNPQMKYANDLVKDGNLTFAYKEYIEIFERTNMFEAGYNAACILEAQGKYEEAETLLLNIYNTSGNSKALELLRDIRYEISQRNKLIQQNQTRALK